MEVKAPPDHDWAMNVGIVPNIESGRDRLYDAPSKWMLFKVGRVLMITLTAVPPAVSWTAS